MQTELCHCLPWSVAQSSISDNVGLFLEYPFDSQ